MTPRSGLATIVQHVVLAVAALVIVLPFLWMVSVSLTAPGDLYTGALWPAINLQAGLENYAYVWTRVPLPRYILNGVIVCSVILFLQVLIAAPAGYALAKLPFRGRGILFACVLLGLLIPIQVPAIPLYVALAYAGLLNTYTALVLPFIISMFAIFLFRQFFLTYPDEIIDAARLDGFSELAIVWRLMLPAAKPAIAAFACVSVIANWNDLYWPLVVVTDTQMMTPPMGLASFRASNDSAGNPGALMAGGVIVTAPLVLGFLFLQRHLIRGFGLGVR